MGIRSDLDRIKNAKAALKTAIEGKGVTVPSATLIDGYPALVEDIEGFSGEGIGVLQRYKTVYVGYAEIVKHYGNIVYTNMFRRYGDANNFAVVKEIYFVDAPIVGVETSAFNNNTIIHIYGAFDATNITLDNLPKMASLQTITFVPNTIGGSISFQPCASLLNDSLLSIANGLDAASPDTLTLHATSKTNCNSIMVDNSAGMAVPGSAMTLTNFITTVKGWTIA